MYREMKVKTGTFLTTGTFLSLFLNVDSAADDVTCDGRPFQVFAAATQNARSPTFGGRVALELVRARVPRQN